ncbi:TVP38/TMEM64 family protein [Gracilibacillus massiliensis]|uniref:TVP38/TMEM64 family protein n=1 Tax=Gracilibacillus massiliensis TaxID=1564956 RepID=UPI00071E2E96|nr:VTT domain-containing protein [Gracilibacillus massiliensis]
MNRRSLLKIGWHFLTTLTFIASICFIIYGFEHALFYSEQALDNFLGQFGFWAPILFIIFQFMQVILPIVPGGIGCLAGILIFGPIMGLIYNYIGICLGSIATFAIARNYGTTFISFFVSKKLRDKYQLWVNHHRFHFLFTLAIFSPIAPDDYLCFLAGTTKMTYQKFITIILIGKPLPIIIFSFGLEWIFKHLVSWLS